MCITRCFYTGFLTMHNPLIRTWITFHRLCEDLDQHLNWGGNSIELSQRAFYSKLILRMRLLFKSAT